MSTASLEQQGVNSVLVQGRWVGLRPVTPDDLPDLYLLSIDPSIAFRWRYGIFRPNPEDFSRTLFDDVLVQLCVVRGESPPLGIAAAYSADLTHGHAYIGGMLAPSVQRRGWALEGIALFIEFVFRNWPLRKIYLEIAAFNRDQFPSITRISELEGTLTQHVLSQGKYWDVDIRSICRERWSELAKALLGFIEPPVVE